MEITIDSMNGKQFSKLVDYINSPENISKLRESQYLKVGIIEIGICQIGETQPPTQFYGNIQLQVHDAHMTSEELSGLIKLIHKK